MFIFRGVFCGGFCGGVVVTFLALLHPVQELKSMFPGNFRSVRCSATSGPRTDVHFSW